MSLLLWGGEGGGGGGAYARDKNTSVRVCAKNAGGAYAQGGGGRICGTLQYNIVQAGDWYLLRYFYKRAWLKTHWSVN